MDNTSPPSHNARYYAHWQPLLTIVGRLSQHTLIRTSDSIGTYAACVLLCRNALEVYANELFVALHHRSHTEQAFTRFINLHICERLRELALDCHMELLDSLAQQVDALNRLRNYCVHYSAGRVTRRTWDSLMRLPELREILGAGHADIQKTLLNRDTTRWCLSATLTTIEQFEATRSPKGPSWEENVAFCRALRVEANV
jgi:hypothetical protein